MYKTTEFEDWRDKPDTKYQIIFQGESIHPCGGWVFFFTWGGYVFNICNVRGFLGLPKRREIDYMERSRARFNAQWWEILAAIGKRDFVDVLKLAEESAQYEPPAGLKHN